jgi:hypothetical protein
MATALHTLTDDLAFENVEGCEQTRGSMTFVVMRQGPGLALHRQAGLGAVERLDLALHIDRQNNGVVWRTDIEPDDIAQLGDELRLIGQLELTDPMGLQAMGTPDACSSIRCPRSRPHSHVGTRAQSGERAHEVGPPK